MFIRIGQDRTVFRGDSEYGNPVAIWKMLHNSKFDDGDADTDTDDAVVLFPALIVASTSPLCPRCCGRYSLFVSRHEVVLVVLVVLLILVALVVLVGLMLVNMWVDGAPINPQTAHQPTLTLSL
jgi:hypothetical protein